MVKTFILFFSLSVFASGGGTGSSGVTMEVLGNTDCGQEGQEQCAPWKKEFWDTVGFGCDEGLRTSWDWKKWKNFCVNGVRQSGASIFWIYDTLRFQRHLLKDERIYQTSMIDAHNAFQYSNAGAHLVQNQKYSPTELLNMGVRILSIDVHRYRNNMRLVHCEHNATQFCNILGRYWSEYLEELKLWIDRNPTEFVILKIENYLDNDWSNFTYPIQAIIGRNITFTQADLNSFGGKMPSLQTLRDKGKKIVFFTQNGNDGNWSLPQGNHFTPGWSGHYVKNFDQANCIDRGIRLFGAEGEARKNEQWMEIAESYGKILGIPFSNLFFDGRKESGTVDVAAVRSAAKCGVTNIQMDWVDNDRLAASIWSWDVGEPRNFGSGLNCVKQRNGRWYTANCGEEKRFACKNKVNKWDWKITTGSGRFNDGQAKCSSEFGGNYVFDFPNRGDQNELIRRLVGSAEIWLKYWQGNTETGVAGTFYIVSQISNKAVTEAGDSAMQFGYLGANDNRQSWILDRDAQGFYQIKSKSNGKCLDSFQDGNGGKLGLWGCHGGDNQKWTLVVKGDSNLSLQNKRSKRCADISGSKKNNYDTLMGWDCYNVIQHYFKLYKQ
ncbi:MAG: RICIN domain-containing protein [Bacteriovoracales bacterium]